MNKLLEVNMLPIPFKAFRIGAERINQNPVKYNKTRISGSNQTTYNLHIKGACMPGQKDKFTTTSRSKTKLNKPLFDNQNMKAFQLEKIKSTKTNKFVPNDDYSLLIAINASYRQVFGNILTMESERPIDIERRLRNGDITIREFIRQICKSDFYQSNFYHKLSQYKYIQLSYKHILGRSIKNKSEIIKSSILLHEEGFSNHVDWLIDSNEYNEVFGEDIVPYMRGWNSPIGFKTRDFLKAKSLAKAFATSDNCLT